MIFGRKSISDKINKGPLLAIISVGVKIQINIMIDPLTKYRLFFLIQRPTARISKEKLPQPMADMRMYKTSATRLFCERETPPELSQRKKLGFW